MALLDDVLSVNTTSLGLAALGLVLLFWTPRRRERVPNGPASFPFVGSLPAIISKDPIRRFEQLRLQYGDVYSLYIGQDLTVVLNGYDVIHDALIKNGSSFSARPRTDFYHLMFQNRGIVFANGNLWKEQRNFAQTALNEFGYKWTYKSIEDRIQDEITFFIDRIEQMKGPFDIKQTVNLGLANVIAGILFGKRYSYDHPEFIACLDAVGEAAKLFGKSSTLMSCFPILRSLPGDLLGLDKIAAIREKPQHFVHKQFLEHDSMFDENNVRDMADLYLKEIRDNGRKGDSSFTCTQMQAFLSELISAGTETTATTMIWILLYIIHHPEIQNKLHSHIDDVIGTRVPSLKDRENLQFVEATILEGLRIAPVAPLSVPHSVDNDVTFRDYLIPRNTTILVNLHSSMKDPDIWPEPDKFQPERFLDESGRLSVPKEFIAFSIGRRSCLGESLARMELFLFMTSLLQKFEVVAADETLPSLEGHLGMTYSPAPFKLQMNIRHS